MCECAYTILKRYVTLTPKQKDTEKVLAPVVVEESDNRKEEENPADRWFPVGLAGSVGRFDPTAVAQRGCEGGGLNGARAEDGLGRPTFVGWLARSAAAAAAAASDAEDDCSACHE